MSGELQKLELKVRRGSSVALPIRVMTSEIVWKPITGIAQSAPMRVTCASHGLPNQWPCGIVGVQGMRNVNVAMPLSDKTFKPATVVDQDTFEYNDVNSAGYPEYVSGGHVAYYRPLDLTQYASARMDIKGAVADSSPAFQFTSANGKLVMSAANEMIELRLTPAESKLLTLDRYVFDVELVTATGDVRAICSADSTIVVLPEVTGE